MSTTKATVDSIQLENTAEAPKDSLKRRYIFKILANIMGLLSNLVVASIVPRTLGPRAYGDFNFVTHFFDQIMELIDGRSSVGALVKISFRPKEAGLVVFYLYFSFLASFLVFGLVGLSYLFAIEEWVWPGQETKFILLGCLWSVLVWLHGVLHKMCDAFGLTVEAEKVRAAQKVIMIILLLALFFLDQLNLSTFFTYYIGVLGFLFVGFFAVLWRAGKWPSREAWVLGRDRVKGYAREFYVYSLPLFVYFAFEALVAVVDRWLLQRYAGSEEQGYFGFAYQMGHLIFLFVGAMTPLIQREFSVSYQERDYARLAYLFKRYLPLQFAIAVFFGAFICFQADRLIGLFAGQAFSDSFLPLMVLAFYSVYFTFGRVTSSVFFAMGANKLFRNLGVSVLGFGLVLSWLLLAPQDMFGLDLGATGLAIKALVVYFILINLQLFFNTRLLRVRYRYYVVHQILAIGAFILLSYWSRILVPTSELFGLLEGFLFSGVIYCGLTFFFVSAFPSVFGLHRDDIKWLNSKLLFWRKARVDTAKDSEFDLDVPDEVLANGISEKLCILILSARSSIHTVRWVNALAERGHQVHLVSMHDGGDPLHPAVIHHHLKIPAPLGYFFNLPKLRSLLKKIKPDLLHVHYVSGYGTLASLSGFQPRIVSVWGSDIFNFPLVSMFNEWLVRWNVKHGSWVCSTSYVMAHQTLRIVPEAKGKLSVTPFGIDLESFKPDSSKRNPRKIVISSVKTLDFRYGIDLLIRSFALLVRRLRVENPELAEKLELRIAGKGILRDRLEELTIDFDIEKQVKFLGQIPHRKVPEILAESDIFSAPSREDSFGVAIIEASSCELPVVVTRVGGLQEVVVDDVTGFIVEKEEVQQLADAFYQLATSKDLREKMGKAGRQHVDRLYNWSANVSRMEWLYQSRLNERRGLQ